MIRRIYNSVSVANADISADKRFQGMMVPIDIAGGTGGGLQLYWYKSGIADSDLVPFRTENFKFLSGNYSVLVTDETLLVNSTGGTITLTIDPAGLKRKVIRVKKISTDGNAIVLQPSTGNIDGFSSLSLYSNNEGIFVYSDGTNWYSIAYNGLRPTIKTITSNYTFNVNDQTILCDTTTGSIVISLNPANFRRELRIKKISSDINTVTIAPTSGSIDGSANYVLSSQFDAVQFQSDGTNLHNFSIVKAASEGYSKAKAFPNDSDYTLLTAANEYDVIFFDALTADRNVIVPDPATCTGITYNIKHGGDGLFNLILSRPVQASNVSSYTQVGPGQSLSFTSDGTKLIIIK